MAAGPATLRAGLDHERSGARPLGVPAAQGLHRRERLLGAVRRTDGLRDLAGHVLVKAQLVAQPPFALVGRHGEEGLGLHPHARRAPLAAEADAHGAVLHPLDGEAHERLVHAADLLDVEGLVREALSVQVEQLL